MKRFVVPVFLACTAVAAAQSPGGGQRNREGGAASSSVGRMVTIEPVVTKHSITVGGRPLAYTATAGTLPIRNDDGEIEANVFFVAYTKDGAELGTRPITFAYNGGPGSSSTWLHMGVLGPRRVAMNDDGTMPKPPFRVVDNQETWLESTDVVMVDAIGTGYSRPASAEAARKFYSMTGDIAAFGEFVRAYLAKSQRFNSPIYLAGESYGGIRTAGLAGWLTQRGIGLSGAIIVSGVENYITSRESRGNVVPYISFLPSYTATAWYHKKLGNRYPTVEAATADAEKFALGDYTTVLMAGTNASASDRNRAAQRLAALTGLSETYVKQANLKISPGAFFKELLRSEGKSVGRLDSRITAQDAVDTGVRTDFDASDAAITPPFYMAVNDYLSKELKVSMDDRYRLNNYGSGWEYGLSGGGYPDTSGDLRDALARNPHMKVLFNCGYYDMACPYFGQKFTVGQMDLRPEQLARISFTYYPAGHMMYIEKGSREKLKRDIDAFYAAR
ncbi:peptidase S10 [bacterium]|nr:MAG: peptidase S10 [bacterium]